MQLVKVNWAWITMPLALLMISGAFLLATVVRTSDDKAGTLKTSGISSLFNSLQDDENGNARRGYTSYKMDGSAIRLVG